MSKKLTRRTIVNKLFKKKADFWKFSATMIIPVCMGVVIGILMAIFFKLDFVGLVLAIVWFPLGWMLSVGDKSAGEFLEEFQKVPKFRTRHGRRTKIFRK
jgi:F0F1-type ATP synthase assembly protein I